MLDSWFLATSTWNYTAPSCGKTSGDMVDFEHWVSARYRTVVSFFLCFLCTSAAAYLCIPKLMNDESITVS